MLLRFRGPGFREASRDKARSHCHVTTPDISGPRTCGMTSARDSAARKSEPVTQIRSSGAVNCRASSSASAGSCGDSNGRSAQLEGRRGDRFGCDRAGVFDVSSGDDHVESTGARPRAGPPGLSRELCRRRACAASAGSTCVAYRPARRPRRRCARRRSPARASRRPPRPAPATERGKPADDVIAGSPPALGSASASASSPARATAALCAW